MMGETPAQQLDQLPADRQADTEAAVLAGHGAIQLEEALIQGRLVEESKADSGVGHDKAQAQATVTLRHTDHAQAHRAFGNSGAYGVAKAGIAGLTRSQSEAWAARGVTANSLTPGLIATPMTTAVLADPERAEYFRRRAHTGTLGAPSDFAAAAVFLAGEGSRFVTGQNLCVDGGLSVT